MVTIRGRAMRLVGRRLRPVVAWTRTWGVAVVHGRSMQPTLYDGDRLVVRYAARPRVGRLAVVRLPDGVLAVKRVTMRQRDGWWVERDNIHEGVDSWSVGAIAEDDVVAVVRARLWPHRLRPLRRSTRRR